MHHRPSSRVYAGTTGQCLLRDTADVDEAERSRAVRDFEAGVKLVVDGSRAEVRGVVPVVRSAPEAFVFVVDVPAASNPVRAFYRTVETIVDGRDGWSLNDESQAARAVRTVAAAQRSVREPTTPAVGRSGTTQQYPNLADAVAALDQTFEAAARAAVPERIVVADIDNAAHIAEDALYVTLAPQEDQHDAGKAASSGPETTRNTVRWPMVRPILVGVVVFVVATTLWWSLEGALGLLGPLLAAGVALGATAVSSRRSL